MADGLDLAQYRDLGLRLQEAIAGFLGGMSYVFLTRNTRPFEAVGCVFVGTATANYMADSIAKWMLVLPDRMQLSAGASGFLAGLLAMAFCSGVIAAGKRWNASKQSGG